MNDPTQDDLRALGLDDASLDRAWSEALTAIRADGGDPDAVITRAALALEHHRNHPAHPTPDEWAAVARWIDDPLTRKDSPDR